MIQDRKTTTSTNMQKSLTFKIQKPPIVRQKVHHVNYLYFSYMFALVFIPIITKGLLQMNIPLKTVNLYGIFSFLFGCILWIVLKIALDTKYIRWSEISIDSHGIRDNNDKMIINSENISKIWIKKKKNKSIILIIAEGIHWKSN